MGDAATWNTASWLAVWALILGLSLAAVVRMFRRGRIESHDQLSLMPPKIRAWILGESSWLGRKKPPAK
jgi:hypothetical protein